MAQGTAAGAPFDAASLYDDAPCGLIVTAPDGLIQRVNRTFCGWVGRPAEALVGRVKLQDLLTMGGRIFHHTHWGPLMQIQGSVAEIKLEVLHPSGRRLPMVWHAVRRSHGDVTVHEVAAFVAEDRNKYEHELVLARRRAEELLAKEQEMQLALREAQAERDRQQALAVDRALFAEQMMAIVSHDLRNPLSVIKMSAHILGMGELSPKQKAALARLGNSNNRATRLISDLLDFSRGRMGTGLQIKVESLDLHAVVAEALEDLRMAHPGRSIEHRIEGTGTCLASTDRLLQLIGNLVTNAATYGAPDRPIEVRSAIGQQTFSVAVHNEGTPIPADLVPRLFDPMSRGSQVAGYASSVGLGLFIVREIAHAHGGEVGVVSSEADGTTFLATFPRAEGPCLPAEVPERAAPTPQAREHARQAALDRLAIDTLQEAAYDDITRLAAETCDAPIALISLVDRERQWFKSRVGLQATETPREYAFCAHAIQTPGEVFVVQDAALDPRFATNPLVTGDPCIRFYAGAPLVTSTGEALGTVCVIDRKPRSLEPTQLELLRFLAQQVVETLEKRERDRNGPATAG
ncbi:ATP-binding protein [Pseudorhodoferax sp. Leaf274]|uniref:ATP-binding protein n=1 Tax=Pseudorhodoferax sp. Leaf274 TaxID=1736318 RepID=UPI0012E28F20|nr:ATP-binding protein [Pseudorhodoferax sp. Leaf274]